jgi:hypothetical protein
MHVPVRKWPARDGSSLERGIPGIRARRRGRDCYFWEGLPKVGDEFIAGLLRGCPAPQMSAMRCSESTVVLVVVRLRVGAGKVVYWARFQLLTDFETSGDIVAEQL